jgi:hypothetical protein
MFILSCCLFCVISNANAQGQKGLSLTSPAFKHNQMIPKKFTCQGSDINPQLDIAGIPAGTKGLALIVDDPDAPGGELGPLDRL